MTLNITLSTESIQSAISTLQSVLNEVDASVNNLVRVLTSEGAEVAQSSFGNMLTVREETTFDTGKIIISGKQAGVAEFGAGYSTMEYHPFAGNAPFPVEVASYSKRNDEEDHGGMFYWSDYAHPGEGYWFFGGSEYDRVQPKHGLLNAYDFIVNHSTEIAQEVFSL